MDLVESLDTNSTLVGVSNTTTPTQLYLKTIPGGSLGNANRLRLQMQGKIGFLNASAQCNLYLSYAGITAANSIAKVSVVPGTVGFRLDAELSADGSVNSQFGTTHLFIGVPIDDDASTPVGFGSLGAASNGDQDLKILAQWNNASVSNNIQHYHSTLELISFTQEVAVEALDEPTAYLFLSSKLNNLHYSLRKYAYFYAPMEHELDFIGYGSVTFTRGSTSTATYRDGASHSVAVNEPRFEYSGDTPLGTLISTSTELLQWSTQNALNNSNTICWLQDNVYKSTARGNANPINASGQWTGTSGVHIREIVKFSKQLTSSEDAEVETALTT